MLIFGFKGLKLPRTRKARGILEEKTCPLACLVKKAFYYVNANFSLYSIM